MLFNLFGKRKNISSNIFNPHITDISLALPDWELYNQSETRISWYTAQREAVTLQLLSPALWNFTCNELTEAKLYWQEQTKELGGVLIELNSFNIQNIPALSGIFKYRSPEPNSLAMYYVGIIWLPFKNFLYQINYEDIERGVTGSREAAVMLILDKNNPIQIEQKDDPELVSIEELFQKLGNNELTLSPSDAREYDEMFPTHPLSRIRHWLDNFANQAKLSEELKLQPVYKI